MVEPDARFFKPPNFDDRLREVQRRIEELSLRSRTSGAGGTMMMNLAAHQQQQ